MRTRPVRARLAVVAAAAVTVLASACVPPPDPPPDPQPIWIGTRIPRAATPDGPVNQLGAWTDDAWFATVEVARTGHQLTVYPRSGPGGSVLGEPQRLPIGASGLSGPFGEHLLGVQSDDIVTFFGESGGAWAELGSQPTAPDQQLAAMTDDWLVTRRVPDPSHTTDGEVHVYALEASGGTVTATLSATLGPDPAWPAGLRAGFGRAVSLDGDLLAVSAVSLSETGPGGVRVFRATEGTWAPIQSLGAMPTSGSAFGQSLAVDDGDAVDRLVLSPSFADVSQMQVQVYADTGGGFAAEQAIHRDPSAPDISGGLMWGSSLAIDGDRIAIASRQVTVPSADPSHDPVTVGHVEVHRHVGTSPSGTWAREAEVSPFLTPHDAGVRSAQPFTLELSGTHLAVSVLVTLDTPPGCHLPCLPVLGMEAWSFLLA